MNEDTRLDLLNGLLVVELGDGIAGSAAAAMLADLGARVETYRLERSVRESAGPRRPDNDGGSTPLLSLVLDRYKTAVRVAELGPDGDCFPEACARADIVICDLVANQLERFLDDINHYLQLVDAAHARAWVTIAPFGLHGPFRSYRGSELVCGAAGGSLATTRSAADGQPVKIAGLQSLVGTGQFAALAALHGLDLSRRRGQPTHLEVSAQESVIAIGPRTVCAAVLLNSRGAGGPGRVGGPPSGLYPCSDGLIYLNVLEDHQWQGVAKAMEFGEWAGELASTERVDRAEEIVARVRAWTSARAMTECADELQRFGVPAAPVNGPNDLLTAPQLVHRSFFKPAELDGLSTLVPRLPFRATHAARTGRNGSKTIAGLRVLEFGHVIAAPFAASLIGAMGADVLRVENRKRLDVYRRSAPYADNIPGESSNCMFIVNNHSKRVLMMDDEPGGERLVELLKEADVVVENWGRSRAGRLGIDAATLAATHEHLLAISSSGFGSDGPMGDYRAYAQNVHAFGGIADLTRDRHGELVSLRGSWADLSTGVVLATVIAAWALGSLRGTAMSVDLSMAEVVASRVSDYAAAAACNAPLIEGCQANSVHPLAPNNVYRVGGQTTWFALSVISDEEWRALQAILGDPPALSSPGFDTVEGRWTNRDALDDAVQDCLIARDPMQLFTDCQAARVRACPVWTAEMLVDDPHLNERGFFVTIDHPELGARRTVGLPWQIVGEGHIPLSAAT